MGVRVKCGDSTLNRGLIIQLVAGSTASSMPKSTGCASTADAPPPTFTSAPAGCILAEFRQLTTDDVITAVRALPDKQSASDPLPTQLLKEHVDLLAPIDRTRWAVIIV